MIIEIKIPSPGESVSEVEIASWLVENGDFVEKDQEIAEVESDKATLPLMAEESGIITIKEETGKTISVGTVACTIDTEGKGAKIEKQASGDKIEAQALPISGKAAQKNDTKTKEAPPADNENKEETLKAGKDDGATKDNEEPKEKPDKEEHDKIRISPLARKLMEDENLSVDDVINGIRRITRNDVSIVSGLKDSETSFGHANVKASRESSRQKMSLLRRKLSVRLVAVKNETAMLTTFNEVDMSKIMELRQKYQSRFVEKHGVKLGFMSVFAKAVTETLKLYPNINSYLEDDDIITPQYIDIGIAVQTEKGLMVPVLRNTEVMGLADIEKNIITLAEKARKNRISIEDMSGGTFTITNGGVFGSLLSTPILNPPQSAILGMHNIVERPVAIKGKVEIRPMMYIALSYDHRIIDGKDSVGFLVKVKEMLEEPVKLVFRGQNPEDMLLDL
ncbi:MAG: 2-oxoglutarate dehydrogenase complex dihydrolipoyllysine-residue succinyltransferase [Bacteroidales bacterium]